jgi:ribosomal-protein-alanine N-acetyltransferase
MPGDRPKVEALFDRAQRISLRLARHNLYAALSDDLWLVETGRGVVCACGLAVAPPTVAQIQACALADGVQANEMINVLLPAVQRDLCVRGVETLAYVGIVEWLLEALLADGFEQINTIVAMQKSNWRVPDRGSQEVLVRPVQEDDLEAILDIDQAAFVPLWRNTMQSLIECLSTSFFRVADCAGQVTGYVCLMMLGRHAHLSRVAVHPAYQGRRIGTRLLSEALAYCQAQEAFGITLNTQRDNDRARRLYEWFGFQTLGTEAHVLVSHLACDARGGTPST